MKNEVEQILPADFPKLKEVNPGVLGMYDIQENIFTLIQYLANRRRLSEINGVQEKPNTSNT